MLAKLEINLNCGRDSVPKKREEEELMAEREGFEPSSPIAQTNTLAGCRFRPLSHLSVMCA